MRFHHLYRARTGLALVVGIGLLLPTLLAAEKGKVTVEKIEYKGYPNNLRLTNGDAELILTLDVGPRIISYKLKGGKNVFVELADQMGKQVAKLRVEYRDQKKREMLIGMIIEDKILDIIESKAKIEEA